MHPGFLEFRNSSRARLASSIYNIKCNTIQATRFRKDSTFKSISRCPQGSASVRYFGDPIAEPNAIGYGYSIQHQSAAISVKYKFRTFLLDSFIREDYGYVARDKWTHAALCDRTSRYDPSSFATAREVFASSRAAINLVGSHTITNVNYQTNSYDNGVLLAMPYGKQPLPKLAAREVRLRLRGIRSIRIN